MIAVREATARDVPEIRNLYLDAYGTDYIPKYYDEQQLTRLVYSDDVLFLVAEDTDAGRLVGTASVDLEYGAHSDLVGEFGRLVVHPAARRKGVGALLMQERLRRVGDRIQVGMVEARVTHPYSLKIVEANHFAPVGFLPSIWHLHAQEGLMLLARHFGDALRLRRNHPRVAPELYPLAHVALQNCAIEPDAIVDEDTPAYASERAYDLQELTTEGYPALLRIERGRVRHREIFGPVRLHDGAFKLAARQSTYLIARDDGRIAGAAGFTISPHDHTVRIFELISLDNDVIPVLLKGLARLWTLKLEGAPEAISVHVSAHAPRMQRTLLELGFLPVAYVPALAFDQVERVDIVEMLKLASPPVVCTDGFTPACKAVADLVLDRFRIRQVLPRVAETVNRLPLFNGLDEEQVRRLAGVCDIAEFLPGQTLFREGDTDRRMYVVLEGDVAVVVAASPAPVGHVRADECLGETSLLTGAPHSATATARTRVEAAVIGRDDLADLVRLRPDIGLCMYRNLAIGAGEKLKRLNASLVPAG